MNLFSDYYDYFNRAFYMTILYQSFRKKLQVDVHELIVNNFFFIR